MIDFTGFCKSAKEHNSRRPQMLNCCSRWFDSDPVLMNANMPLEVFLPPLRLSNGHLSLSKDWNGMNNGIFFMRVHEWSVALLSAAMSYPTLNPGVPSFWHDQSALNNLDENDYFSRSITHCPLRWFNAYMRSSDSLRPNSDSPPDLQIHSGDNSEGPLIPDPVTIS